MHQMEVSLGRLVRLRGLEDNTQCIAAIQRGYSPALRHLQRHCRLSLGFTHEVFFPDKTDPEAPQYFSKLEYCDTNSQKGDWMTKESPPTKFQASLRLAGYQSGFSLSGTPELRPDRRTGLVARFDGGYDYASGQIAAPPGSSWPPLFPCDLEEGGVCECPA